MKFYSILLILTILCSSCNNSQIATAAQKEMTIGMGYILPKDTPQKELLAKETPLVFIAGYDEEGSDYYRQAATYFKNKNFNVVEELYSLEEILDWLQAYENKVSEIHIVNHSNAWRGMALKTTKEGERITQETLANAIEKNQLPAVPKTISNTTKIVFHSCGLGTNTMLLAQLQKVFSNKATPQVIASPHFNVFGGKYASHYLATPYYVFYPTAHSPGPLMLSQEMEVLYPNTNIDWFRALKTREETALGAPYSYRFNVPVDWTFKFEEVLDIPAFEDKAQLLAFIKDDPSLMQAIQDTGIPLSKFRWRASSKGNSLHIKGKTTVLSVLKPIMNTQDSDAYLFPEISNTDIYTTL